MSTRQTADEVLVITTAGIYDGMSDDTYHSDPVPGGSLSSTGVRLLTPPSTPAHYRWAIDNPKTSATFEHGHAAHALVLGTGPELVRIDADEWRTNAIKDEVAAVRERGAVPLKPAAYDAIHAMADRIREHPDAAQLLTADGGLSEQSAFWRDPGTGVWCRARYDRLPPKVTEPGRRLVLADYKTTVDASTEAFVKSAASYGYHQQQEWYRAGLIACGYDPDPVFLFVAQEKTAPYLVNVIQLDHEAGVLARRQNARALGMFRDCQRSETWPGHPTSIDPAPLPGYFVTKAEEYLA
ncbi:PD-(D/E)XK nuclease-like domain-containing protein [Nocardioides alkalitolerans]|uniref:PD-(D/E)XK nuclease-like domain-containing protein n=1 Tax=Nocardioides alkalitolerans TaxID=281714 RepID=UPI000418FF62|nr:PD-(D/E)XK nuclease-like domain-containing protein [Nocardioides alkalitolerans]